jgi:hypothetical protein
MAFRINLNMLSVSSLVVKVELPPKASLVPALIRANVGTPARFREPPTYPEARRHMFFIRRLAISNISLGSWSGAKPA